VSGLSYRDVSVVVLGAGGFIGRWVARQLSADGARLVSVVRDPQVFEAVRQRWDIGGRVHRADLASPESVRRLCTELRPTVVFNLLGYGVDRRECDRALAWWLNGRLPAVLAEAIASTPPGEKWAGRRLIHAGSALEYGTVPGDLAEDGPTAPTTLYGRSKLVGTLRLTRAARRRRLRAVTARLFTVFGAGEHSGRLLPSLEACARSGTPIDLTEGNQRRDFLWVGDVASQLLRLGLSEGTWGEVVNLASGQLFTVKEFTRLAAAALGIPPSHLRFGALPTRPEEMVHAPVTIARLHSLVGPAPSDSITRGLAETVTFLARSIRTT